MGGCCSSKLGKYQLPSPKENVSFSNHIFLPMKVENSISKDEKEVEIENFSFDMENLDSRNSFINTIQSKIKLERGKQDIHNGISPLQNKINTLKRYVSCIPTSTPLKANKTISDNDLKVLKISKISASKEQENYFTRKKQISALQFGYFTNDAKSNMIYNDKASKINDFEKSNYVV